MSSGTANERQVGGDHYKSEYQHWDYVHDVGMRYHPACASKYVTRYDKKSGLQDLEKSKHYLQKATELKIPGCVDTAIALLITQGLKDQVADMPVGVTREASAKFAFFMEFAATEGSEEELAKLNEKEVLAYTIQLDIFVGQYKTAIEQIDKLIAIIQAEQQAVS